MSGKDLEKGLEIGNADNEHTYSRESSISTVSKSQDQGLETAPQIEEAAKETSASILEKKNAPSSVHSNAEVPAVPVPRSQRRGLFGRFSLLPEVDEPKNYSRPKKWFITAIVAFAAAAAPTGSGVLLPALSDITRELHTNATITNLSVALYMLAMAVFPLWWSSFSETLGRRSIYLVSFATYILWCILSAISNSIGMFIVFRMLNGGASASVQAVGAGTIADIWEVRERGRAMGIFYLGPLCGPLLSPIIGGALNEAWGWRSTQWFCVIYGGLVWLLVFIGLPETLKARISVIQQAERELQGGGRPPITRTTTRQSVQLKTKKWLVILHRCFIDPLKIILYLRFGCVAITVWLASTTFFCLYFLNISVQQVFGAPPYGYSSIIVGLLYIPNSLGYIFASVLGGRWVDYIMHREARKAGRYDANGKLIFRPTDRMGENAWVAAVLFPLSMIWYGWTADKGVIWIVPVSTWSLILKSKTVAHGLVQMIANFFFGIASMIIFGMATTMLTEFMPGKASHGIATNNFIRNIFATIAGVVAEPLIRAIGNGYAFTIQAIIFAITCPVVILLMKRYGDQWRARMDKELNGSA
ncbi:MAG: hypothetical protein M1820_010248 [Bogoriella megaspora]|nr:MAG: hypothetical protein M1820_010248 [Bogoriella megaspora]